MPNQPISATPRRAKAPSGALPRFLIDVASVCQGDDCLMWPYGRSGNGYCIVRYNGKQESAHRRVCILAHGEPPTPEHEAAHSCGNGHLGCLNQKHLRWASVGENRQDMIDHGRSLRGAKAHFTKLTEDDVRQVRMLKGYLSQRKIAAMFGISQPAVRYIHTGQNWGWLQ